jgi:N-acetyl-anhydromuramyl-L-alanine amidase AmpD
MAMQGCRGQGRGGHPIPLRSPIVVPTQVGPMAGSMGLRSPERMQDSSASSLPGAVSSDRGGLASMGVTGRGVSAIVRRHRRLPLALVPVLLVLAGCGPRVPQPPQPPFPVQTLADAGLKPLPARELAACATTLGLSPELARPAHPTNFGQRQPRDVFGRTVPHTPQLIVLHETVISAADTVKLFATAHPRDEDQASYHLLVDRSGQRLRIVPDAGRAYGAGMAAFGDFTVRIRPTSVGAINNVALHLSLETPPDGRGESDGHSGYTSQQYRSAAAQVLLWQAAHGIPMSRVTTHQAVDRSHTRSDPRSFRWQEFDAAWREAVQACGLPAERYDRGRATI